MKLLRLRPMQANVAVAVVGMLRQEAAGTQQAVHRTARPSSRASTRGHTSCTQLAGPDDGSILTLSAVQRDEAPAEASARSVVFCDQCSTMTRNACGLTYCDATSADELKAWLHGSVLFLHGLGGWCSKCHTSQKPQIRPRQHKRQHGMLRNDTPCITPTTREGCSDACRAL